MAAESASGPGDRVPCLPGGNSSTEDFPATDNTQIEARKPAICHGMLVEASAPLGSTPANTRTPAYGQPSSYLQYTVYAAPGGSAPAIAKSPSVPTEVENLLKELQTDLGNKGLTQRIKDVPQLALEVLNLVCAKASNDNVKTELLVKPPAQNIITATAASVNGPFNEKQDGKTQRDPIDAARSAVDTLVRMKQRDQLRDPAVAGALLSQAFQGHEDSYEAIQNGRAGSDSQNKLAVLLSYTASTSQGQQAAAKLAESEVTQLADRIRSQKPPLPPEAKNALDKLQNSKDLAAPTRLALLSQIENYRDNKRIGKVIECLKLLAVGGQIRNQTLMSRTTQLFRNSPLAYQQRYAKVIAGLAGDSGDPDLSDKTLNAILDPKSSIEIIWDKRGMLGEQDGLGDDVKNRITLNPDHVPSDNDKLSDDRAIDLATETVAHELSHIKNHISRTVSLVKSQLHINYLARLQHELCAGSVGVRNRWGILDKKGLPIFNRRAAYRYFYLNFIEKGPVYADIKKVLQDNSYQSQDKNSQKSQMLRFVLTMIGIDPDKNPDKVNYDYLAKLDPDTLSSTEPATLPKDIDGVPYNYDNH
jgi:hypothetical protein